MANKTYNFIMNIISRDSITLSNLEKTILDKLKDSDIDIAEIDINTFAHEFFISNSSITRFAQKLGFNGFTELKYALHNHENQFTFITQNRYHEILSNIDEFSPDLINFIRNFDKFERIIIIGIGSSGLMANEFTYKLGELGLYNADYAKEPYKIDMLASSMTSKDLMICLSLSGEHENILKGAKVAYEKGAKILSITGSKKCSLCKFSEFHIKTPPYSTHEYSISKVFPILLYVDIICEIYANR